MITLLSGENSFEISRALDMIVASFDGNAEKFDGSELELSRLPDLLMGGTLFADKRLVIIRDLSDNKQLWDALPDWLDRVSDDVQLVLVEAKPDKRTKTYKELKKKAETKEFTNWGDRDAGLAEQWVTAEAKKQGMTLDRKSVQTLVDRIGLDQWELFHALEKLAVLDAVTPEVIASYIDATPLENVFNLLEAALRGDTQKISDMIQVLQRTQDPYMTLGLLSSQVFQMATLSVSKKPPNVVASDIGAHPYALGKLAPHAKKMGQSGTKAIVRIFADADMAMKSTATDPWLLIEKALIKTTAV